MILWGIATIIAFAWLVYVNTSKRMNYGQKATQIMYLFGFYMISLTLLVMFGAFGE